MGGGFAVVCDDTGEIGDPGDDKGGIVNGGGVHFLGEGAANGGVDIDAEFTVGRRGGDDYRLGGIRFKSAFVIGATQ
jgi:hypothetical protein